jgi:hypothetical protein
MVYAIASTIFGTPNFGAVAGEPFDLFKLILFLD